MAIHDITRLLHSGMAVFPGDTAPSVVQTQSIAAGNSCNLSRLEMCVHNGTHADAPLHFLRNGGDMETIPLDRFFGICRVIEIAQQLELVSRETLVLNDVKKGERLLIKTANSYRSNDTFYRDYVALDHEAAMYLAEVGIMTLGMDCLSVGRDGETLPVHLALLGAGICILEGLDLSAVMPGEYLLSSLPIRLAGVEGCPVRAVLVDL